MKLSVTKKPSIIQANEESADEDSEERLKVRSKLNLS